MTPHLPAQEPDTARPTPGAVVPELRPGPEIEALLFDCDGTLVDTMGLHQQLWTEEFARYGFTVTDEWFQEHLMLSGPAYVNLVVPDMSVADVDALEARLNDQFLERLHELEAFEHVVDVARAYHGVLPMAVVSGGFRVVVEASLTAVGIRHLFDPIVTLDDVERTKPDPEGFLRAAALLGVDPTACLVYEDSAQGFAAAAAAGMRAVDVREHDGSAG